MAGGYAVGIVHYRSYDDLARCLESVARQTMRPEAVHVLDGDADPDRQRAVAERFPWATFESAPNRGYAGGANRVLARLGGCSPATRFFLLLNPDVELDPEFAERLIGAVVDRPDVALATGKLLRPDRQTIDSAGIDLPRHRRPRDRGSEQRDEGQLDQPGDVFGASGAAMLLRRDALADLALAGEIFDEDFFVYHEDTDLCWRARRLGWRVHYEPGALALHARGWQRSNRFAVPIAVRRHSFKNHYLQLIKNESASDLVRGLPVFLAWEAMRLGFAVLRDPAILPAYGDAWRLSRSALRKRRLLREKLEERPARPVPRAALPHP
jgi:GT2 family glycosyltransferase